MCNRPPCLRCKYLKLRKINYRQLCDGGSASYGAVQCSNKNGGCPGSYNNNCNPNIVWSGAAASSTYHYYRYLNSGSFTENSYYSTQAFGVRCVLDLKFLEAKEVLRMRTVKEIMAL